MNTILSLGSLLVLTGILIPCLAWISKSRLDGGLVVPRLPFYVESSVLQLLLAPYALWVAHANGFVVRLGARIDSGTVAASAGMLALSIAMMKLAWSHAADDRRERLLAIVPRTAAERLAWVGLSIFAGCSEEILYRGVLPAVLDTLGLGWWPAVLLASVLFGLAHLVQGWKSSFVVMVFGALFHLLVRFSDGLGFAIVIHVAYDLIAGFVIGSEPPAPLREGAAEP